VIFNFISEEWMEVLFPRKQVPYVLGCCARTTQKCFWVKKVHSITKAKVRKSTLDVLDLYWGVNQILKEMSDLVGEDLTAGEDK